MHCVKRCCLWGLMGSLGLVLAFRLSIFDFVQIVSCAQSAVTAQSEEAALRAIVESYFAAYNKKDQAGIVSLWSEMSPDLATYKQSLQQEFTSEDLSLGSPTISQVKVENGKASLRAAVVLTSINLKSQQKSDQQLIRVFEFALEAGAWKVWRYASAADGLAEALVKAVSKAEREALLTEERELVTGELAQAVLARGRRLSNRSSYDQVKELYELALDIAERCGDKSAKVGASLSLGDLDNSRGNYPQALEHYQKSLKIAEEMDDKASIAGILNNLGFVQDSQGNHAQALEHYEKSLAISEKIGNKSGMAGTLNNIGSVHQLLGNHAQTLQFAERAVNLASNIGSRETLWQAHSVAGKAYFALNQLDRARQSFDKAIAIIEALRAQVAGGEQDQQRYFESRVFPYQAMIELLIAQNSPGEALIYAERARARVLLDVFSSDRVSLTKAMTGSEVEQERKLNGQLASLNTRIYREKQRKQPDQSRLDQLESELQKARLDFEAFQTNLYAAHPELKAQRGETPPLRLEQAGLLLPDVQTALLEFVVADEKTYLFVLTKSVTVEIKVYPLEIKKKDLTDHVNRFRSRMANKDYSYQKLSQELYSLLLKPAEKQLQNKAHLIISPDGVLWDLPFQVLQSKADRYLIEDAAISYAPSLSVLREMQSLRKKRESRAGASILALGNPELGKQSVQLTKFSKMDEELQPLPEAGKQVTALRQLYGKVHSKIYTGAAAREEVFKRESATYRIIHLATHGILNNASPMYSHIMLAQTLEQSDEDGLLEAWEIRNLNLNADLAVLSACETARGHIGAGEGVIGLSWALFVAGCPTTVISQWKVKSSSTTALMVELHKSYKTRFDNPRLAPSTAEAMRQASLKLMKDKQYQHPFYWGGFVVVGDGQ